MVDRASRGLTLGLPLNHPVASIEDVESYEAIIEVLDYLFELGDRRTAGEMAWYRALARLAYHYELDHAVDDR